MSLAVVGWGSIIFVLNESTTFLFPQLLLLTLETSLGLMIGIFGLAAFVVTSRNAHREFASEQETLTTERSLSQEPSIASNPTIAAARSAQAGNIFQLIFIISLLGLFELQQQPYLIQDPLLFPANEFLLFVGGLWLTFCMLLIAKLDIRLSLLYQIERHRAAVVAQERTTFRRSEYISEESVVAFRTPITILFKRGYVWLFVLIVGLGQLAAAVLLGRSTPFFWPVLVILSTFIILPISVSILISLLRQHQTIHITPDGLRVEERTSLIMKSEKFIAWQEAQLFACYRIPSLIFGRKAIVSYELSSSRMVVTWRWIVDSQSLLADWKPLLSTNEYHHQMQALVDLITARTGLELHDLSQEMTP